MPKAKPKPKPTRPQPTVVHVVVTTDGPVPMKAVREAVEGAVRQWVIGGTLAGQLVTKVSVKRDADVQRPQR